MGMAQVSVSATALTFEVDVAGLTGDPTAAHLHIGTPLQIGPAIAGLPVTTVLNGRAAAGSLALNGAVVFNTSTVPVDSLRRLVNLGTVYVDVHTTTYPGGELRGQLEP